MGKTKAKQMHIEIQIPNTNRATVNLFSAMSFFYRVLPFVLPLGSLSLSLLAPWLSPSPLLRIECSHTLPYYTLSRSCFPISHLLLLLFWPLSTFHPLCNIYTWQTECRIQIEIVCLLCTTLQCSVVVASVTRLSLCTTKTLLPALIHNLLVHRDRLRMWIGENGQRNNHHETICFTCIVSHYVNGNQSLESKMEKYGS